MPPKVDVQRSEELFQALYKICQTGECISKACEMIGTSWNSIRKSIPNERKDILMITYITAREESAYKSRIFYQKGQVIEAFANNPNLTVEDLKQLTGARYQDISEAISSYFYVPCTEVSQVIVKQSRINDR